MILTCPECSARYVVDPTALLPSGRMVRCAKCKHSWKEPAPDVDTPVVDEAEATGPDTESASESPAPKDTDKKSGKDSAENTSDDTGEDEFAIKRNRRKKRPRPMPKGSNLPALQNHKHGNILWGWYGLGAFVAIIISCFLLFQSTISEIWTPSQKLYHALGMDQNGHGQDDHDSEEEQADIPYDEQFKIKNTTINKTQTGKMVTLKVKGHIANLTDTTLPLPLLRISLIDSQGQVIREWTFKASSATIAKGEDVSFATSLPNPPQDATKISVTFAEKH